MKLSGAYGLAAGAVVVCAAGGALLVTGAAGCSSSGGTPDGGSSSGGSDNCAATTSCVTQPAMGGGATTVTASHNYAMSKLYLGDTSRAGQQDLNSAWEKFGYNLDNLITTAGSADVCTLVPGAGHDTQTDGVGGIDNSFGRNILPIVFSTGGDVGMTVNKSITDGKFTLMTYVTGFDDSNTGQTATGLTGFLFSGSDYTLLDSGAPAFNASTNWPVAPDLLTCGASCPPGSMPTSVAKVKFPSAYVTNGTFVNGTPSDVLLSLSIGGQSLTVTAHAALLTFQQSAAGKVTNGTIAGVLDTNELLMAVMGIAGHISKGLCSASAFKPIADAIRQSSDIILNSDGTIKNVAGEACNAISIGLGFDAVEIAPPTTLAGPAPAQPDPCADAGSD